MEELLIKAFKLGQQWVHDLEYNPGKTLMNFDEWYYSDETQSELRNLRLGAVVNQRGLLLKQQSDWLMTQTRLPVEQIVEFTERFKQ